MHLCIDIGNTREKYGLFDGNDLLDSGILSDMTFVKLRERQDIKRVIYCSTRKRLPRYVYLGLFKIPYRLALKFGVSLPITTIYDTPETLGQDRVAGAVAANILYPETTNLVIDAGTCVTMDVISKSGNHLGGNIAPGMYMRLQAMHDYTGKLPMTDLDWNGNVLGRNTADALRAGAVHGLLLEIEGLISKLESEHTSLNIILTGGDAQFLAKYLKSDIFVQPNLVLFGLNEILHHHADIS